MPRPRTQWSSALELGGDLNESSGDGVPETGGMPAAELDALVGRSRAPADTSARNSSEAREDARIAGQTSARRSEAGRGAEVAVAREFSVPGASRRKPAAEASSLPGPSGPRDTAAASSVEGLAAVTAARMKTRTDGIEPPARKRPSESTKRAPRRALENAEGALGRKRSEREDAPADAAAKRRDGNAGLPRSRRTGRDHRVAAPPMKSERLPELVRAQGSDVTRGGRAVDPARLVIGELRVEVVDAAPPSSASAPRAPKKGAGTSRTRSRASRPFKARFGLGQL